MRISAIIPAYNVAKYLPRAVRSLIKTGYHDLEIVIVEDGSEDGTFKITEELCRQYHDSVVVYQHPKGANLGVSASRNLGILKSTGALICFLDVDAVYETVLMVFDDDSGKDTMAEWGKTFGLSRKVPPSVLLTELLRGRTWHTSGILCRRTLFDKTGLFNTKFCIAEDCNLWFKMACVGKIIPGDMTRPVSGYHRHGTNTYLMSIDRKPDMVRAMADACRWGRGGRLPGVVLDTLFKETRSYISNSVAIALQANRMDLAWKIIKAALKDGDLIIFANLRLIQTIAWLCRKTIHN